MMYIESLRSDLDRFSRGRDAEHKLPKIISSLIFASAEKIIELDFPSDKGVYSPGFDGYANIDQSLYSMLPDGESIWELKCHWEFSEVKKDYYKRTKNTPEPFRKKVIYIAVYFRDKYYIDREWFNDVRKKNEWKDVRLFSINEMEHWISSFPSVLLGVVSSILHFDMKGNIRKTGDVAQDFLYTFNSEQRKYLLESLKDVSEFSRVMLDWYQGSKELPLVVVTESKEKSIFMFHNTLSALLDNDTFGYVFGKIDTWNSFIDGSGIKDTLLIPIHKEYNFSTLANEKGYSLMIPVSFENMHRVSSAIFAIWKG